MRDSKRGAIDNVIIIVPVITLNNKNILPHGPNKRKKIRKQQKRKQNMIRTWATLRKVLFLYTLYTLILIFIHLFHTHKYKSHERDNKVHVRVWLYINILFLSVMTLPNIIIFL